VSRSDDGYMSVLVSPGPVTLELRYGADAVDWLGRSLAVAGLVATGMVATWRRRQAISLQPRRADERPLDPARR
jgi:hypothetical protein